jgi:hypothetical protein
MKKLFVALVLASIFLTAAAAQDHSELDQLDAKAMRHIETKMPGWRHRRGQPIKGSENVLIERWGSSNRVVSISVVPHKSANEARQALNDFVKYDTKTERLNGFGDEAFAWGYGQANVVFRRGRFNVYVSTYAEVDADADASTLSSEQRGERERLEMRRLSREFAKHMVSAIDLP